MSAASTDPRRTQWASRFLVLILGGIFLLGLLGFVVAVLDAGRQRTTPAPPSLAVSGAAPAPSSLLLAVAEATPSLRPAVTAAPTLASSLLPSSAPSSPPSSSGEPGDSVSLGLTGQSVPVVPVARFWSSDDGVARRDLVRALETGRLRGFRGLIVEDSLREALTEQLGIDIHAEVQAGDLVQVRRALRRGALALVAATDLGPSMRALKIDGRSLVGNDRVRDAAGWPLLVTRALPEGEAWDQAQTWVLVAGGDSFTDRGVYDTVVRKGRGAEFPFGGGTARVTGHGCCDPVYNDNVVPRYQLTGDAGAVRRLFRNAELAIANHEMPTTEAWDFHGSGFRFSGRPDLTKVFTHAGIDWLSLANNHIKDYGTEGIADTRRILRRHGLAFGGAGEDLDQARRVSYLEVGDTRVAIIPCVGVAPAAWAGPHTSGGTPCLDRYLVPDIKKAKREADLVIVFPHWGVEYTRQPLPSMRKHAARWEKAGADLILGAHSHVAGAIEEIDGMPVLYSLGNLIFDQHWSTNTMESALVEATFHGDRLVDLRLRPYIIHATSQPNLLDPATGEGRRLLRQVRAASADWLDW